MTDPASELLQRMDQWTAATGSHLGNARARLAAGDIAGARRLFEASRRLGNPDPPARELGPGQRPVGIRERTYYGAPRRPVDPLAGCTITVRLDTWADVVYVLDELGAPIELGPAAARRYLAERGYGCTVHHVDIATRHRRGLPQTRVRSGPGRRERV